MTFSFKPFEHMTPDDYAAIGLKCGLEVHQQLLTRRKLFCRCPAGRYSGEYDAEILRHMRPTLSELGEYDGTALMERKTQKNIFYRIHRDTVCTYEFDDTPPFFADELAIDIALELALLLRVNLVGEIHIARKQYLDGSIPTGFQRTTILGIDGWIPYQDRKIGITQLGLEEDSCREVSDIGHDRVYLTDRLGMPLIEVVTDPDMRTPQEAAEVCQIIRMLCRSTQKVRTGYGATREDVNVSVRGGTRIEIKGVPQITRIPLLIHNEAMRQCALLAIRDTLNKRGVTPEAFAHSTHDVGRTVAKAQYEPIRKALAKGLRVKCVVLKGFAGVLSRTTQENTTFATEFSDRIRVIACLTGLPNMVHSDTASEALSAKHWKELRRRTKAEDGDALVLVWGDERDTACACEEIANRAREATEGVPSDTRQAHKDGTNGFERVLPGPQRMYPDTDLPPIVITAERLDHVRAQLPSYVWDFKARCETLRLPADVIFPLCVSARTKLFERIVDELGVDPVFTAVTLIQQFKALRREGLDPDALSDDDIYAVFRSHANGTPTREGVLEVFKHLLTRALPAESPADRVQAALQALAMRPVDDAELARRIAAATDGEANPRMADVGKTYRFLMGRLMKALVGCVAGVRVARALHEKLGMECDILPSFVHRHSESTR